MEAAKRKTFWLMWIASAILLSLPALASSVNVLHPKTRAELSAENGQFSVERQALNPVNATRYYDWLEEVASESSVAPVSAAGELITVPGFRNGQLLAEHYAKHARGVIWKRDKSGMLKEIAKPGGPDMPEFASLADYKAAAQRMWTQRAGGDIIEHTMANGERLRWNAADKTFGVLSKDGYIRTFFRPDRGYDYFLEACK